MAKESRQHRKGRSRSRRRSRSPSSDRSPSHKRSSRHRSPRKKSHKDKSAKRRHRSRSKEAHKIIDKHSDSDKEDNCGEESERLEREMRRRRERVEQWRITRKKLNPESSSDVSIVEPQKKINLDNDEDDDDDDDDDDKKEKKEEKGEEEEGGKQASDLEVDPLDAFMMGLDQEIKQGKQHADTANKEDAVGEVGVDGGGKVDKGELMEANMDDLEYSSDVPVEDDMDDLSRASKKKELPQVDHSKVMYGSFRKDFYIEVPEVANMSAEEVAAYRKELDDIAVTGLNPPKPIKSWAQCGFSRKVLEILKRHNFIKPTPIQAQSLPIIMSGRDMIGIAKTGSGKTLAFLLPMLRHVCDQPALKPSEGPIAVVLTPTRELAMQIGVECRKFCKNLNLRCLCIYGGRPISEQIAELKRGAEVVVCTPGRMIDMLTANSGRVTNLRRCTYTVLDEADRMFDMGFEQQVLKIINNIRPDSQTVLFSATFPPKIENLARRILTKPFEVAVGAKSVVCAEVEQHVTVIDDSQKFLKLLELLGIYQEQGSVLVFVHKQEHADELMKNLMKQGYPCMSLHGGIDQFDRDSSMQDFKQGNIKLLIATSVCSRGLDVKDLILVLNYDCPNHYEDYVHRCGRTGRAGNRGYAYTFVSLDQGRYAGDIIKALKYSKAEVPEDLQKLWQGYKKEAEAEGRQVKSSSGFKGKGFKFDETEAQLADDRRKLQKAALGLQDSDEEDAGVDIEEKIEQMFASKKWVSNVTQNANKQSSDNAATQQKLQQAKKAAEHINKLLLPSQEDLKQQTAAAIIKGGVAISQVSSKTIAEQMAERINAKLGYRPVAEEQKDTVPAEEVDNLRRFEEELEINDFPQTARWKVTSREALGQICEYSEAGITVRGSYFPPNKEPKDGDERKLYLAIEASSEIALNKAKSEVTRLIKEELVRLQNSYQPINRNRYKVV